MRQDPASLPPTSGAARPSQTTRNVLVSVLTVATGALDVVGILRLGGVLTSVMTANMVLLGVSAGKHEASLALHAVAAFAGYIVGVAVGSRVAGSAPKGQPTWPRRVSATLGVELGVLAVFATGWETSGGHPIGATTYWLLVADATASGIQSAAVLRLGVSGLSTTYLTGTLTQLVAGLRRGAKRDSNLSVALLLAVVLGAALGSVLATEAPRLMPIVPVGALLVVLAG